MEQLYNEIVNELQNVKKTANQIAKEVEKMEVNLTGVPETKEKKNHSHDGETRISFASYEMQAERFQYEKEDLLDRYEKEKTDMRDRFEKEKDKMRKNYHRIIAWISGALITFLLIVFFAATYVFNNFEFASYAQDSTYGNSNFIGNNGDITNGETVYPNNPSEES